jgi:SPP1 gp7 family putative phage head morphogenesis protein
MPDPEVIQVMRQFKRDLLAGEQSQMQEMARRWLAVERRLQGQMDALALEMAQVKRDGGTVTVETLMNQTRYRELMTQLSSELETYSGYVERSITDRQGQLVRLGVKHAEQAITSQGLTGAFNRLPIEAVEHLAGFASNGSPLSRLLMLSWPDAAAGLTQELITGIALGYNPRKTAKLMAQGMTGSLDRMMTIARTEQLRSYRSANLESYRASGVVTQYKRLAAHDSRVCAACLMAEGTVYELSEVMATHPNCVIEGTLVSTPQVVGTSKRAYDGPVLEIVTVKGNHLTVTPNHPVLTDKGWVAARFLKEGDNVISSFGSNGTAALVAPNNQQGPAAIEDIVAAFCESSDVIPVSMKVAAEDFHSDGMGSDVAVIGANRLLQSRFSAAITYPFSQDPFLVGCMGDGQLLAYGAAAQVVKRTDLAPNSVVGGNSVLPSLFRGPLSLHQPISVGTVADRNTSFFQSQANHGSYCPVCGSQSVLGLSSKVTANDFVSGQVQAAHEGDSPSLEMAIESSPSDTVFFEDGVGFNASAVVVDRIVNLSSRQFSGHVYNLQTVTGWYVANGIITHNCRCTMVPIVRGLPSPQWKQGQEWFEEQDQATQKSILGKGKYYAWQNGDFELGELVKIKPNATWGDTLQTTTLGELTGPKVVMPVAATIAKTVQIPRFANSGEAAQWLVSEGYVKAADFGKLDADAVDATVQSIANTSSQFGRFRGSLDFVGSAQARQSSLAASMKGIFEAEAKAQGLTGAQATRYVDIVSKKYKPLLAKIPDGHYAYHQVSQVPGVASRVSELVINEKWGKKSSLLVEQLEDAVERGWHPQGVTNLKGVLDHETTHELDRLYKLGQDSKMTDLWIAAQRQPGGIADNLSQYAASNKDEFMAEAWAEYQNNPSPRPLARQVGELIRELTNDSN